MIDKLTGQPEDPFQAAIKEALKRFGLDVYFLALTSEPVLQIQIPLSPMGLQHKGDTTKVEEVITKFVDGIRESEWAKQVKSDHDSEINSKYEEIAKLEVKIRELEVYEHYVKIAKELK